MKNKILFIESGMGFGGAAVSMLELCRNFCRYEPVIVSFSNKDNAFNAIFSGFTTHFLNTKISYFHKAEFQKKAHQLCSNSVFMYLANKIFILFSMLEDARLYHRIKKIAISENAAVIHINNCVNPIALKVSSKLHKPAIVHLRGHVDCAGKNKTKYNKFIYRLIAPTNKIRDYAINKLDVKESKISVIYNSVTPEIYCTHEKRSLIREEYRIPEDSILVGMFARIIPMKGQLELAKAIYSLSQSGINVHCMFIGDASDGDIDYLNTLQRYIKNNGISEQFIFTGYKDNVAEYYSAVDIVVHGSIANEAFGRVIIEGWASRKPVVATDIPASVELISHEYNGIIVQANNISMLASSIRELINDKEKYHRISENGYLTMQSKFNSKLVAGEIEKIYDQALTESQSQGSGTCI